jgi:hypothetical protein
MSKRNAGGDITDVLLGNKLGEKKRWRIVEEVKVRGKGATYIPFAKDRAAAARLAKFFGVPSVVKPAKDGVKLVGFRKRSWKRPIVGVDAKGQPWYMSETAARAHYGA